MSEGDGKMTKHGSIRRFAGAAIGIFLPFALLLAPGCSKDDAVLDPPDTTPPAATALRIERVTENSVTFSWRAPGDDDMVGRAASYDLRYATFELSLDNWFQGTLTPGLPTPETPRSLEEATISGLVPGQTYFFALRSADEIPNLSAASGVVNLTLPAAPGYPVLWGGRRVPEAGTTQTAFIYQARLRRVGGVLPSGAPEVVVNGAAHPMRLVSDDGVSLIFEFALQLPAGSYSYNFRYADAEGQQTVLPNPGSWPGPSVEDVAVSITDFVDVPVDTFSMGNSAALCPPDERPAHLVVLTNPFRMDRHEITNSQYCEALNWAYRRGLVSVVGDTLVQTRLERSPLLVVASNQSGTSHGIRFASETGFTPIAFREDWPVTHVTWYGAAFYCNVRSWREGVGAAYDEALGWLCGPAGQPYAAEGWRLPAEAEWEYAARYNDGRTYPTGDTPPIEGVEANYGPSSTRPAPVGSYPQGANPLGIMDLAGNVWEWCNDWLAFYRRTVDGEGNEIPAVNPAGPRQALTYRIGRGGSWGSEATEVRGNRRFGFRPETARDGLGFRCVQTIGR
jgi:formylglycine-generating enzyme required for sulfatase activity